MPTPKLLLDPLSRQERDAAAIALVRSGTTREAVHAAVGRALSLADFTRYIPAGTPVSLKPNLGWDKLIPGAISAPWVVEGVVLAIRKHVGRIYLVEADQVVVNAEHALRLARLDTVCKEYDVTWVNMSRGQTVRVQRADRRILRDIEIHEILTRTALITLPVMKTHNKTTITGALKNQWGCLPTLRHNFHLVLNEALADVNTLVQPRLAVMDATVGLEGDGPKSGRPKEVGLVLASASLCGLDATAARIMGFEPERIEHLKTCSEQGFGRLEALDVIGESVDAVKTDFLPAKHNAVSWFELLLRRSMARSLVFETPVLKGMSWGARRYYDVWDATTGARLRKEFLRQSPFAEQWR